MLRVVVLILSALYASASVTTAQSQPAVTATAITYQLQPLARTPGELQKRFTEDQIAVLEKLNRRDRAHLVRTDPAVPGLIVPTTWEADENHYSPLPALYPSAEVHPKLIVVHQPWQVFAAYESGRLIRWGPISTGRKETATPSGVFHLTWKAKSRRSTDNQAWLLNWYFNFVNERGISFHQFDLPGYPASHACVRLLERDAQWLYGWGNQWKLDVRGKLAEPGTPVLVIDSYAFGAPMPWTVPESLARPLELPPAPPAEPASGGDLSWP